MLKKFVSPIGWIFKPGSQCCVTKQLRLSLNIEHQINRVIANVPKIQFALILRDCSYQLAYLRISIANQQSSTLSMLHKSNRRNVAGCNYFFLYHVIENFQYKSLCISSVKYEAIFLPVFQKNTRSMLFIPFLIRQAFHQYVIQSFLIFVFRHLIDRFLNNLSKALVDSLVKRYRLAYPIVLLVQALETI